MQFRKGLASLLTFAMMMTMIPLSSFASDSPEFTDMPDDWSAAALKHAVSNGLLFGDSGMIRPADNLTRAQMQRNKSPLVGTPAGAGRAGAGH